MEEHSEDLTHPRNAREGFPESKAAFMLSRSYPDEHIWVFVRQEMGMFEAEDTQHTNISTLKKHPNTSEEL